jgi:3-dehydroquinate dehydratase/shikimate dehydrogenase
MPKTLLCCPIMVDEPALALRDAEQARASGADLVEYRIDRLFNGEGDDEGQRAVLQLVADSPVPCIVTCRSADEGGEYDGDDSARVSLIEALGTADDPPKYIDFEAAAYGRSANLRQKINLAIQHDRQVRDVSTGLILSAHDFHSRPSNLFALLASMRSHDAAKVIKLAFRARSIRDNLEIFDILRERDRPTIVLGMGEHGLMSRVLAPKFGGFLTFASLTEQGGTAPGQPTIAQLRGRYRFDSIGEATKVYGVIGDPVAHSISPDVHNAGFESVGHDGVYLPLRIDAGWESFKATLLSLLAYEPLDFRGASVTIPHKENLLRLAIEQAAAGESWEISPVAFGAGAANTLAVRDDGTRFVDNTDALALKSLLREALSSGLAGVPVVVLGAGGVARGACAALLEEGARVTVCNRTTERAERLRDELHEKLSEAPGSIEVAEWDERHSLEAHAWINGTSIGMSGAGAEGESPLDFERLETPEDAVVLDTVYAPRRTALLAQAEDKGLRTIDGVSVFVRQAIAQSVLWTGDSESLSGLHALFTRVSEEVLASET